MLIRLIPVKSPRVPPKLAIWSVIVTLRLRFMTVTLLDAKLTLTIAIFFSASRQN